MNRLPEKIARYFDLPLDELPDTDDFQSKIMMIGSKSVLVTWGRKHSCFSSRLESVWIDIDFDWEVYDYTMESFYYKDSIDDCYISFNFEIDANDVFQIIRVMNDIGFCSLEAEERHHESFTSHEKIELKHRREEYRKRKCERLNSLKESAMHSVCQ